MKVTTDLFETVRQPEYTGKNRCAPCTWANSVIAVVLSLAVGALVVSVATAAIAVAAAGTVLGLSTGAIYLRGYLVPGTPELTAKYFPVWLFEKFDKSPAPFWPSTEVEDVEEVEEVEFDIDPVVALQESGAVRECPHVDDLCLSDAFRRHWHDQFDRVWARDEVTVLADHFDVGEHEVTVPGHFTRPDFEELDTDPDDQPDAIVPDGEGGYEAVSTGEEPLEIDTDEESVVVDTDEHSSIQTDEVPSPTPEEMRSASDEAENGQEVTEESAPNYTVKIAEYPPGQWPSREALFAEVAASNVLEDNWDWEQWSELKAKAQSSLLNELRLFLDRCPACGTELSQSEETVESCCTSGDVFAVSCESCERRLFESELST